MTTLPNWVTKERAIDPKATPWAVSRAERNRIAEAISPFVRDNFFATEEQAARAAASEWDGERVDVDADPWRGDRAKYIEWRTRDLVKPK